MNLSWETTIKKNMARGVIMQIRLVLSRSVSLNIMVTYMTHVSIQSLQSILNFKKSYTDVFSPFSYTLQVSMEGKQIQNFGKYLKYDLLCKTSKYFYSLSFTWRPSLRRIHVKQ